ncbi:unnamed protein product [Rhizophagus irregularis]|uniref:MACPF domain-containing protein n=1 Tax=Rhizophagus irregularis TaxID=588596 RepID=A0A2I1GW61_9GLOM|nr:hypothetical protein RhiirA4_546235 [Rhizophagus irregularis]CAB4426280.1 unnamed protein product [Rhizophagus irregularis]
MSDLVTVNVIIVDVRSFLKKLNKNEKLSKIREVLSCDDKLSFLKGKDGSIAEDEEEFTLNDIFTKDARMDYSIYLKNKTYWDTLNENHKLDYGRIITDDGSKTANKGAFNLKGFNELKEINGHRQGTIEISSNEELIKKRNLFFKTDGSIYNFIKLGLTLDQAQEKIIKDGRKLVYNFTEVAKASLKLSIDNLEPIKEFIEVIKVAAKSKKLNLKKITEDYGLFIPTEIIMGGRFYTNETEISSEQNIDNTFSAEVNVDANVVKIGHGTTKNSAQFHKVNHMKSLGGNCDGVFDEDKWTESLKDYRNWDCIEFNNPVSIFQLLPYNLRKELFVAAGKKILFTGTLNCKYYLHYPGNYRKFELKRSNDIPKNILNIIQNEDADCDFFATAIDVNHYSKNDFFTCQILKTDEDKLNPSIIIHAIQKEFRPRTYELNIVLMVVGYDIDFNFITDESVEIIKKQYDPGNNEKFDQIILHTKYGLKGTNIPFFGMPVLNSLKDSNDFPPVIGHNFHDIESDHELKVGIFSYCSKDNCYLNLPNFTFCTLIISDPDAYISLPFKFRILKKPFINLDSRTTYVNCLQLSNEHRPIFLHQKMKRVNIEYVKCSCNNPDCICHEKTRKISGKDNSSCVILNL